MKTQSNHRRGRAFTFLLSLGMLAGVLIWAKLRLVTDIPRSALAVPKEVDQAVANGEEPEVQIVDEMDETDESGESLDEVIHDLQESDE